MFGLPVIAACFLIVLVAGMVQGLFGFGSGLLMVPLLVFFLPPEVVVPVSLLHGLVLNLCLTLITRRHVQIGRVTVLFLAAIVGLPLGALLLLWLPSAVLKVLIGTVIIAFAIALLLGLRIKVKRERAVMVPVGAVSGILNGSLSLSGPPVILFFAGEGLDRSRFKANLVSYFLLINIVTIVIFIILGLIDQEVIVWTLATLPPLLAGMAGGLMLWGRFDERAFRKIVLVLVAAAGLLSLVTGAVGLFT